MERPVLGPIDPVTGRPLYLPHDVVSGTEATGLEPIPPRSPEEAESYAELYDWPLADQPPRRSGDLPAGNKFAIIMGRNFCRVPPNQHPLQI